MPIVDTSGHLLKLSDSVTDVLYTEDGAKICWFGGNTAESQRDICEL